MNELSLFSGAGGGLLGTKLLGWRCVGYVENETYCQAVIRSRIEDGYLHEGPIFSDIRDFIDQGYAEAYKGMADVITAGFPCTPHSRAGKQKGEKDERNLWPETMECIRIIRPGFVFLENAPDLVHTGFIGTILGDLAECGYDAKWRCLSAEEMGASHLRYRWWCLAYANGERFSSMEIPFITDEKVFANVEDHAEGRELSWRSIEPGMGRVVDEMAFGLDRLKTLGNGQVPSVVRSAFESLRGKSI